LSLRGTARSQRPVCAITIEKSISGPQRFARAAMATELTSLSGLCSSTSLTHFMD